LVCQKKKKTVKLKKLLKKLPRLQNLKQQKKTTKTKTVKKTTKAVKKAKVEKDVLEIENSNPPVEETVKVENEVKAVEVKDSEVSNDDFLKDFDWNLFEEGIETIKDDKLSEFEKLVEENFVDTYNESVIEGTIISLTEREAIIDINAKSEGVISLNEFRYNPDLKVGDKVEVLVDIQEDKTGQLVLSHRKARTIKAWDRVNEAHDKSTVVTGFVKCRTKGGMIVDVFGLEAFFTWFTD